MDATKFFKNQIRLVSKSVNQSKTKYKEIEIPVEKRIRRKRKLLGETEGDLCQTLMQEVKRNLDESHDRLANELEARFDSMAYLQTVITASNPGR